jgi:hypothetical protein
MSNLRKKWKWKEKKMLQNVLFVPNFINSMTLQMTPWGAT